jgi:hypothetical protein
MPLRGKIREKSKLSMDYTAERHAFRGLIRRKACHSTNYSESRKAFLAESLDFLWNILQKGMPFRRIISGKSKLSANYTAERHAFPQNNPRKFKTFRELSCGKFQYTTESQTLTFYRPITTSKANFRQKFNHGGSILP